MRRKLYLFTLITLGLYLVRLWSEQNAQPIPAPRVPRPTPPALSRTHNPVVKDDLTQIDGIGPSYERALNAIGIYNFAQLAAQNAEVLSQRLTGVRITANRIQRDQWIEQASKRISTSNT